MELETLYGLKVDYAYMAMISTIQRPPVEGGSELGYSESGDAWVVIGLAVFPGANTILRQLDSGTKRKRVGLLPSGRAPMREGVKLYASQEDKPSIGVITSGGFGPTVGSPVAMGYLATDYATVGTQVFG